jgi:hypothetical protein
MAKPFRDEVPGGTGPKMLIVISIFATADVQRSSRWRHLDPVVVLALKYTVLRGKVRVWKRTSSKRLFTCCRAARYRQDPRLKVLRPRRATGERRGVSTPRLKSVQALDPSVDTPPLRNCSKLLAQFAGLTNPPLGPRGPVPVRARRPPVLFTVLFGLLAEPEM